MKTMKSKLGENKMTYLDLIRGENILAGNVSELTGNVSGLRGDVSGLLRGDYDYGEPLKYVVIQLAADAGEFDRME